MERTIGIYLRLSQEDVDKRTNLAKDDSNSIVAQRNIIRRYIDEHPALAKLPCLEFCDDGFSGTNFERPDFTRMIEMVKEGVITCIIVKDLSRFGRDYLEVGDYLEHIFPFLGVRMISVNDNYDSDQYQGMTGGMDIAFRNLIYDYYSKDLSKKVKTGMRMRQLHGGYVSNCLYGYKVLPGHKHQMVIDPETAPIVRRIFLDVISGKATVQIARELNMEGIPTPLAYKGITRRSKEAVPERKPIWTHSRIHEMIKNLKYTGCMVNHTRESRCIRDTNQRKIPPEEWIITENTHEAIVSREEFDQAQAAIHRKAFFGRKETEPVPPFYCAHCGRKLFRSAGLNIQYYCTTPYQTGADEPCRKVRINKADMERVLLESLKAELSVMETQVRETRQEIQPDGEQFVRRLKSLQEEQKNADAQKIQSYMDYREGRISKDDFIAHRNRREKRKAELEQEIAETEAAYEEYKSSAQRIQNDQRLLSQTDSFSDEELKAMLYDVIERVMVSDEKHLEIVWKLDDIFA